MKNIIYIRVSTQEQAKSGHSLEYQKNQLLNYCKNNTILYPKIYVDDGYSAGSINRPKYKLILDEIKNKKVKNIVFLKIDRISRNIVDFKNFLSLCNTYSVNLVSLQENFDNTAVGQFSQNIIISLAEMERNQISERTKAGIIGGLQKGFWTFGGGLPLGISKNKLTKKLYYNEDKQIVIDIFRLDENKYSNIEIYKMINKKYQIKFDDYFIDRTLKNTLYFGYKIYGGVKYELLEPLITNYKYIKQDCKHNKIIDTKINKRIKYKHLYQLSQQIRYIPTNDILYASTVKKFLKSTNKYKEYKYYFSKDKKVKLNEKYLLKILQEYIVIQEKDKTISIQKRIKNLQALFIIGDITKEEYLRAKKELFYIDSNTLDLKNVTVKVDEHYNLNINNKIINYKIAIQKFK